MKDSISRFLRHSNSKLILEQPWLLLKYRKLLFLISTLLYKRWIRQPHSTQECLLTDIDGDISMKVDLSKVIGAAFYWIGFHEFTEWRYLHKFLKPDMVFFDVGSNQGEYALFAAKRLTRGSVFAFEPVDVIYNRLEANLAFNSFTNVSIFKMGLSDTKGVLPIYMEDDSSANEGLATLFQSKVRGRFVQDIQLDTLDAVVEQANLHRIDFIKVDIEGAELTMLRGARATLKRFRPHVMVEMNETTFTTAGYSAKDVLEYFKELNYHPFYITPSGTLQRSDAINSFVNVIFVPQ